MDAGTKKREIMNVVKEIERTDDFEKLEQVGVKLNKKLYSFKARSIPIPRITLGKDEKVQ